ncbi:N,N'-diacetylchitobiose transport system substrate-binding protein [Lipingzhangella halophila]|uniref:N,N'-diacetylchitobiose transport system substrate-binding protein n=1 Tax=Lipingzhangella halophila TaxID=1783352 RepID=A0A7W7W3K2_9ACTN|nr:sugar ABC transporter substrate-binding protein [Lipingzhangella halophila]MBB4933132.1 N,N'-diacetylchitobiose transport system substrate-binding protein [Lipingzhangella halophila]
MARNHTLYFTAPSAALALVISGCGIGEEDSFDVWIMQGTNPDATAYFEDIADQFEEETGVEANIEFQDWADAHDQFVTAMAGDTAPDVAEVGTTWTPEFAAAGGLVDITDQVGDTDRFVDALAEAGELDGRMYGMPWYAGVRSVVYRTDVFEELDLEEPGNWDELREVATTIADERDDMAAFPVAGGATQQMLPFIWGNGGELATEEDGTWSSGLASAEAREGIEFYTNLDLEDGTSTAGAATWDEADLQDNFIDGNVAMMISGSWTPSAILEGNPDLEGDIGAFPIPGRDGGISPAFLGGSHLAVMDGADEEAAGSFIELLTEEENLRRWAEESTYFPGVQEQLDPYTESDDPLVRPFAEQMSEGGATVPVSENWGKVEGDETLTTMLQSVLDERATVDEATEEAATAVDETLNEGS